MALGKLIVEGPVTDVSIREGVSRRTGQPYRMVTGYVVHRRGAFALSITEELEGRIAQGDFLTASVTPEVFNGDVTFRIAEVMELVDESGEVKINGAALAAV